jgi:hypothetical protein
VICLLSKVALWLPIKVVNHVGLCLFGTSEYRDDLACHTNQAVDDYLQEFEPNSSN